MHCLVYYLFFFVPLATPKLVFSCQDVCFVAIVHLPLVLPDVTCCKVKNICIY